MRYYTDRELEGLVSLEEGMDALEFAFKEYANGKALVQSRVPTELGGLRINTMAALLPGMGVCGAKVYTSLRGKFSFLILLFSSKDGRLLAAFEAGMLTVLRTAAATALAARYLARPDCRQLTIFGTGAQAAGHVKALVKVLPVEAIDVVGREAAVAFADQMRRVTGLPARVVHAAEAVGRADAIVTATRSPTPLFDGRLLKPGCFIAAVGSARPEATELDAATLKRCARVVVEALDHAKHESGDLIQAAHLGAFSWDQALELGALVTGRALGRRAPSEITLFDSVGFALEDVAVAGLVYAKLRKTNDTQLARQKNML